MSAPAVPAVSTVLSESAAAPSVIVLARADTVSCDFPRTAAMITCLAQLCIWAPGRRCRQRMRRHALAPGSRDSGTGGDTVRCTA